MGMMIVTRFGSTLLSRCQSHGRASSLAATYLMTTDTQSEPEPIVTVVKSNELALASNVLGTEAS